MKRAIVNAKVIFPLCVFFISIVYLFTAKDFALGTMKRPGVGFLPMVSGGFLAIFSLYQAVKEIMEKKEAEKLNIRWTQIGLFLALVVLYAVILKPVGYVIATFLLLLLSARLYGAKSWIKPLIFSAVCSILSYYLFAVLLLVPLP